MAVEWIQNWDSHTMTDIEEDIKSMVNSKISMASSDTPNGGVLRYTGNKTADGSWIVKIEDSKVFLKDVGGIVPTVDSSGKKTLTLSGDTINIESNPININGNIGTTSGTGKVTFSSPVVFNQDTNGTLATFTTLTADEIISDSIAVGSDIVLGGAGGNEGKIAGRVGDFTTITVDTLSASTVTSTNLVGTALYIGANANAANKINLTPTSFTTNNITATTQIVTPTISINGVQSFNGYNTLLQYRPIQFTTSVPTTSDNLQPGTLIAVIQ